MKGTTREYLAVLVTYSLLFMNAHQLLGGCDPPCDDCEDCDIEDCECVWEGCPSCGRCRYCDNNCDCQWRGNCRYDSHCEDCYSCPTPSCNCTYDCDPNQFCCDGTCCNNGETCCDGACCDPNTETCCGTSDCCNNYSEICCDDTICCDWTEGEICCNGTCCNGSCCDSWDCEHCVSGSCEPCLSKASDYEELQECSAVPDPDWTPQPNGCSSPLSGDNPAWIWCGEASSFLGPCNTHDTCYQTCGSSKYNCDEQFSQCLAVVCAPLSGTCKSKCQEWADTYAGAVVLWGLPYWENDQVDACACCDCE